MQEGARQVCLVGRQKFQNELLGFYLQHHCGVEVLEMESIDQVPSPVGRECSSRLVFYDCGSAGGRSLLSGLREFGIGLLSSSKLALFNLDPSFGVEREALDLGVRGFFYAHETPAIMVKGVDAMFGGEIWVSRKKLSESFLGRRDSRPATGAGSVILTRREREILALVATGASNEAIAGQLCISRHTVKAHIYKIFKKIKVPNRLQASFWAAKHL